MGNAAGRPGFHTGYGRAVLSPKPPCVYQMNEPPGSRMRLPYRLTVAEYFRDIQHRYSAVYRQYLQICAGKKRGFSAAGRMPSAVGYQPTLQPGLGTGGRITSTENGSITSVQAIYVPADDRRTQRRTRFHTLTLQQFCQCCGNGHISGRQPSGILIQGFRP